VCSKIKKRDLADVCFSTRAMRVEERDVSRNRYCTKSLRSAGTSRILEGLVVCRGLVEPGAPGQLRSLVG